MKNIALLLTLRKPKAHRPKRLLPFFSHAPLPLCSLALLLVVLPAFSQQRWERAYGGSGSDLGCSVQQTLDGGYIVAGQTNSYGLGGYDVYIIKTRV